MVTRHAPSPRGPIAVAGRSAALDAVRVFGVTAVIVGHAVPDEGFRQVLFAWHVPVFFVLSGYLVKPGRSLRHELGSRMSSLAWPYLFWLGAVAVLYVPLELSGYFGPAASVSDWVGPILGGSNAREPFTTFWFVSALFFVAVLFRLLLALPEWVMWSVAGLGVVAGVTIGPFLASTPLAIGSALPLVIFVAVGRAVRPVIEKVGERMPLRGALLGAGLALSGVALVAFEVVQPVDIKLGDWGTPVAAVAIGCAISIGLVLIAQALYCSASPRVAAVTTALSLAGLCAVLVHPVLQWLLRPFDLPIPVLAAVMLVIPWGLGLVLRHTRLAQVTTGSPRVPTGAPRTTGPTTRRST